MSVHYSFTVATLFNMWSKFVFRPLMEKLVLSLILAVSLSALNLPPATCRNDPATPVFLATCKGSSYTVIKNAVYDRAKVIYRIPPGTKYHLQGCILHYGNKRAFDISTKTQYIPSHKRKRKVPDRVLFVENGKVVKASKGRVYIGDFRAYQDDDLKKGIAHIYYKDGNLYINNNIVMKKNPSKPKIKIPKVVDLHHTDTPEFQLKMRKNFILQYNDKRHEQVFMSVAQ